MEHRHAISVTVVWSPGARRTIEAVVSVPVGCTVREVLQLCTERAGVHLDRTHVQVGIWGDKVPLHTQVEANDRVEVYRPLTVDPKVARRERFAKQGSRKVAGLFANRRPGAKPGY